MASASKCILLMLALGALSWQSTSATGSGNCVPATCKHGVCYGKAGSKMCFRGVQSRSGGLTYSFDNGKVCDPSCRATETCWSGECYYEALLKNSFAVMRKACVEDCSSQAYCDFGECKACKHKCASSAYCSSGECQPCSGNVKHLASEGVLSVDANGQVTCGTGYEKQGNAAAVCQHGGQWGVPTNPCTPVVTNPKPVVQDQCNPPCFDGFECRTFKDYQQCQPIEFSSGRPKDFVGENFEEHIACDHPCQNQSVCHRGQCSHYVKTSNDYEYEPENPSIQGCISPCSGICWNGVCRTKLMAGSQPYLVKACPICQNRSNCRDLQCQHLVHKANGYSYEPAQRGVQNTCASDCQGICWNGKCRTAVPRGQGVYLEYEAPSKEQGYNNCGCPEGRTCRENKEKDIYECVAVAPNQPSVN